MDFLERLNLLKERTGDNNSTLAKRSGIPYTTIDGLYKKGFANVKLSTLEALCAYFGVTLDYLVKGKEDTPKRTPAHIYEGTQIAARTSGSGEEWQQMVERLQERRNAPILPEEQEVVDLYRSLSEGQKRRFKELMTMVKEWGNDA